MELVILVEEWVNCFGAVREMKHLVEAEEIESWEPAPRHDALELWNDPDEDTGIYQIEWPKRHVGHLQYKAYQQLEAAQRKQLGAVEARIEGSDASPDEARHAALASLAMW